jgi:Flp pilus assembly protein CpaB
MPQAKKLVQLVISAMMALLFVNLYLKSKEQNIESRYGMVEVIAASRDIPPHTEIKNHHVTVKRVPLKFMEPGAVMVKVPTLAYQRVLGKVTVAAVPAGGQIIQSNIKAPTAADPGVAPLLPPGKRGFVLRLGNTDVGELILPGNYVDVLATFTIKQKDNSQQKATYTILQNILVVSVGRELRKPDEGLSAKGENAESLTLTLALEPTEAERLSLAQAESGGDISVVVRPHGDNEIRPLPGTPTSRLLG